MKPIAPTGNLQEDIRLTRQLIGSHSLLVMERTCLDPANYGLKGVGIDLKSYTKSTNLNEIVPALLNGEAELALLDVPDAILDLKKWAGHIKVIGPISEEQTLATAFPLDAPGLRDEFNTYLRSLKASGAYRDDGQQALSGHQALLPGILRSRQLMPFQAHDWRRLANHWPTRHGQCVHGDDADCRGRTLRFAEAASSGDDDYLVADSVRRAEEIADFLRERKMAAVRLASSHTIEAYLVNRALGMSWQYGLNANLDFIEAEFAKEFEESRFRGRSVYRGIAFVNEDGRAVAWTGRQDFWPADSNAAERAEIAGRQRTQGHRRDCARVPQGHAAGNDRHHHRPRCAVGTADRQIRRSGRPAITGKFC